MSKRKIKSAKALRVSCVSDGYIRKINGECQMNTSVTGMKVGWCCLRLVLELIFVWIEVMRSQRGK